MKQLTFKEQVIARYLVLEKEETTAGWKDLLKQGLGVLIGGLLFSQSAFGFQIKEDKLKKLETHMKKAMHSFTMDKSANFDGAKYDYKIDIEKDGNVQHVTFKVIKDGKVAGQVDFAGTPKTKTADSSSMSASISEEAKDDNIVNYVVDTQVETLQKMLK